MHILRDLVTLNGPSVLTLDGADETLPISRVLEARDLAIGGS